MPILSNHPIKTTNFCITGTLLFCLIWLCSCTNDYKNLTALPHSKPEYKTFPSIFEKKEKATVFNASFTYKDYFASGLMVIKHLGNGHFRIVFTAKMGQTLLDTKLTPTDFIIKKSIPQLDRKLLFNLLEKDLRMICDDHSGMATALQDTHHRGTVFRLKTRKGHRYFYDNETGDLLEKIERGTRRRKKVVADLDNYREGFPTKITLTHQGIQLTIGLVLIQG